MRTNGLMFPLPADPPPATWTKINSLTVLDAPNPLTSITSVAAAKAAPCSAQVATIIAIVNRQMRHDAKRRPKANHSIEPKTLRTRDTWLFGLLGTFMGNPLCSPTKQQNRSTFFLNTEYLNTGHTERHYVS